MGEQIVIGRDIESGWEEGRHVEVKLRRPRLGLWLTRVGQREPGVARTVAEWRHLIEADMARASGRETKLAKATVEALRRMIVRWARDGLMRAEEAGTKWAYVGFDGPAIMATKIPRAMVILAALTALLGPWPAQADPPARFPAEVRECSIVRHLCSVDPEDGVTPVNEVTYLCPGGEVTIALPWPCDLGTNNDQE